MDTTLPCIFISYSSTDLETARAIHVKLASQFVVWRDEERVEADWSRDIALALARRADAICLVWSAGSTKSKWVKHEWLTARALGKLIVVAMLPGAPDLP